MENVSHDLTIEELLEDGYIRAPELLKLQLRARSFGGGVYVRRWISLEDAKKNYVYRVEGPGGPDESVSYPTLEEAQLRVAALEEYGES
jgi:hypothetical protein